MRNQASRKMALCGITAAMMMVVMMLGSILPLSTYSTPMLAGALLIPILWEMGPKMGGLVYLAVSILSILMAPDKEAVFLFVFLLGWYPIARPKLQHLRNKPIRWVIKMVLFNLAGALTYVFLLFVLTMPDLQAEFADWTVLFLAGFLLLGNVTFVLYDILLGRLGDFYVVRLRPKLFSIHTIDL
ncbi:MAG: hypothetical protein IJE03_08170 [Ruminiclostridium sp.]|nr:hypothetical protein [Ruminiclostridium sp.]